MIGIADSSLTGASVIVDGPEAGLAPALVRAGPVHALCIHTLRTQVRLALVHIFAGVTVPLVSGFANASVVGPQVDALGITVARMSLATKVGAFANFAALALGLNPFVRGAIEFGAVTLEGSAIHRPVLRERIVIMNCGGSHGCPELTLHSHCTHRLPSARLVVVNLCPSCMDLPL